MPDAPTSETDYAAALLQAASEILARDGVKGLSMRRVAERAGCTTMLVYSRYGGKAGLLGALFDEGFQRLNEAQRAAVSALSQGSRVLALCRAYRATAHAYPHHYALMLGGSGDDFTPSSASSALALKTLETLTEAVLAERNTRRSRSANAVEVANRLFAFCHGWVSVEKIGFLGAAAGSDAAFDEAVEALLSR